MKALKNPVTFRHRHRMLIGSPYSSCMRKTGLFFCFFFLLFWLKAQTPYPWLGSLEPGQEIESRIMPPPGSQRLKLSDDCFGDWLRNLPLKPGRPEVMLYNGQPKGNQGVHEAVVNIDVEPRDLQQCADAVMRLRAEYLFACGKFEQIRFNFTSGDTAAYARWREGWRPVISGNRVSWRRKARLDRSYTNFRRYMTSVFSYAGTYSLARELPLREEGTVRIGDVFIQGGFPGHAVMVVDMAENLSTGQRYMLLVQSYMPAQDIHLLRNLDTPELGPWFPVPEGSLNTPEWYFPAGSVRYFK